MNNAKVANINVKLKNLFMMWLNVTQPFHKLTLKEKSVLALLLYYYYQLKHEITNEKILWKIVFDYDTKMKIKEELNINDTNLQNLLSSLRRKKVLVDNKIMSRYIPELSLNANNFKVVYNFNIIKDGT